MPHVEVSFGEVADELKKYKELFDSGAISTEEFDNIKNKLMGNLLPENSIQMPLDSSYTVPLCSNCKESLPSGAEFCGNCGTPIAKV